MNPKCIVSTDNSLNPANPTDFKETTSREKTPNKTKTLFNVPELY